MSTPASLRHRDLALKKIEAAQTLLYEAAQAICPIVPWADEWDDVGNVADSVKALWHRINQAPMPERLDSEPKTPGPVSKIREPLDLKKSTSKEG